MKQLLSAFYFFTALHICAAQETNSPALQIRLASPVDFQVVQRATAAAGKIMVAGTIQPESRTVLPLDELEVRLAGKSLPGDWQPLPFDAQVAAFRGEVNAPAGGWYRLEVRALAHGVPVTTNAVEHVGVGEVFVIAGQSNSANYGEEKNKTVTGLVAAFDGTNWQLAADPEPGAGGKKGSFMPPFGDEMAEHFHVPIGIVAAGIGSTSVREWLPAGTRLSNLPPLTRNVVTVGAGQWESSGKIFESFTVRMKLPGPGGFRAVLWHQGESDAKQDDNTRTLAGNFYKQYLEQLIHDSRREIGWDAPWFVAQVGYHNPADPTSPDIHAAQKAVCDDGFANLGPDTDTLTGDMREKNGTGIHMSAKGLKAHAHLWFEKVSPWLEQQLR
ncbi:MAG TPA: sialate O-acetylesterase [Candidatus Sulfotelmatobacter sp.]|jgi:hypothetical protein|nr:sialate O-acetylesterase [Candidatus Sulfotelmatobacter sp.]